MALGNPIEGAVLRTSSEPTTAVAPNAFSPGAGAVTHLALAAVFDALYELVLRHAAEQQHKVRCSRHLDQFGMLCCSPREAVEEQGVGPAAV